MFVFVLVSAHGVLNDPVEFFVFWTFIPAFMHHGSGGDGWAGGEGGWVGGYDKRTRSTAADQPALLPDYKITWFWGGGGWGGGHDKHTRSTAADAFFTPEAFTGPTFGSRTMGHHFVLALCVAYVLLLRVACAPCPIVDSWFQAFWTCDPFLLDAHFEVFAGSSSDPFAHFAASVGAISARSPLSWCRLPAALPRLRAAWLTLSRARLIEDTSPAMYDLETDDGGSLASFEKLP